VSSRGGDLADLSNLDRLVTELLPVCQRDRDAQSFFLEPELLTGSVRHYFTKFLDWIDVGADVLAPSGLNIHAGLDVPGRLQQMTNRSTGNRIVSMYLDHGLFVTPSVIPAVLSHECAHLFLIQRERQSFPETSERLVYLGDDSEPMRVPSVPPERFGVDGMMGRDDEIATEVASIALGFGKLVLNGVAAFASTGRGLQLGYLTTGEFAHVFQSVVRAVGVPDEAARRGFSDEALGLVEAALPN
jgi:hypothetical protein